MLQYKAFKIGIPKVSKIYAWKEHTNGGWKPAHYKYTVAYLFCTGLQLILQQQLQLFLTLPDNEVGENVKGDLDETTDRMDALFLTVKIKQQLTRSISR
jgi:hypothetical protein